MTKKQYISRPEIAKLLGVSVTTIKNWTKDGCPHISDFGRVDGFGFNVRDVTKWMNNRVDKRKKVDHEN